ncbi:hypothetical protein Pelo_6682 [Pelomyxa schiedti]|nr:hypothetical protein Pelo_6682 [Pelomyxa schiedti]
MSRSRPDFLLGGAVNVEGEGNDEELQLAPCEVIYLCDVLKCLEVHVDDALNSPTVPLNQLWKLFCETDQRFPQIYAVYRNLRLCGWVPKHVGTEIWC